jgi:choline transport protein
MSEEVKNASTDVPRSMLLSLVINGSLAIGMLFAVLFSAENIQGLLDDSEASTAAFVRIFRTAVGSNAGATIMISIIIFLEFCSAMGCLAAASRMTWSFARDLGMPFSKALSYVSVPTSQLYCAITNTGQNHPRTTIPIKAILFVTVCSALLALINIVNTTAFNGTISMVLQGFYLSYLLAIGLLLWRRLRGDLDNPNSSMTIFQSGQVDEAYDRSLTWGPWRLRGTLGVANNIVAICYLLLIIFFSCWPSTNHTPIAQMNFAVIVTGAVLLFSMTYYVMFARKSYNGPIVEVDPHLQ